VTVPVDTTTPNPNNVEYDNLYLDFNGIVHPCSHPEDRPPPKNEEEMMLEIFKYTERVVNMVRPRKLLFIAIDGVAPRAKMNQQRSRRFRSAQDATIKTAATERIIEELKAQGRDVDESLKPKRDWDSNAITPGTEFMDILAASIRYWVVYKLNTDPGWANLNCIISDASVPGEGEHKIMEFIRSQRVNPAHDPNTRHVMYGLDADLIMLGLATHEIHFTVLREDVFFQEGNGKGCRICGQEGHFAAQCTGTHALATSKNINPLGKPKEKSGEFDEKAPVKPPKPFIWLHVQVLREYLEAELFVPGMQFNFDLERAIDDWVFMFFFVGNDFLPHLPSLEIRENAIDTLISIWKTCLGKMGGYVTCDGSVNLARAEIILEALGKREDAIFRRRRQRTFLMHGNMADMCLEDERQKERDADRNRGRQAPQTNQVPENLPQQTQAPTPIPIPTTNTPPSKRRKSSNIPPPPVPDLMAPSAIQGTANIVPGAQGPSGISISQTNRDIVANRKALRMGGNPLPQPTAVMENKSAAEALRAELGLAASSTGSPSTPISAKAALKRKSAVLDEETGDSDYSGPATPIPMAQKAVNGPVEDAPDPVRLWEPGHKERYYEHKFQKDYHKDIDFRREYPPLFEF
jgi:5'-3' exoribonuclease 2